MSNPFLSKDGYINVEEIVALTREIDRLATKEGLKPAEIHFAGKVIPKYDSAKAKAGGEAFTKKRACPIKVRSRMPASGSRVKMVALLRNYKKLEEFEDFTKDFNLALKAIDAHNKQAERVITKLKADGAKKREAAAKQFDKDLDSFIEDVLKVDGEYIDGIDVALGMSMMGKTLILQLPNGGYVSVGKADAERFEKAKASQEESTPRKAKSTRGSKPVKSTRASRAEKSSRSKSATKAVAKVRKTSQGATGRVSKTKSTRSSRRERARA